MVDQPSQREALLSAALQHLLDQSKHPILIEVTIPQICISPVAQLELPIFFCRGHIDVGALQPPAVCLAQLRIDDMEGLLTARESVCDEGKQHPILLVRTVKERADVTFRAQHRAGESNRSVALSRDSAAKLGLIIDGIHRVSLNDLRRRW